MVVDFVIKRAPKYRVASVRFTGPYKERRIRSEWASLARWTESKGLRTGKWFFSEEGSGPRYRFEVAIEVRGHTKSDGKVRIKTLPASPIASVTFDPNVVSPNVVYHGLDDWLRWLKKNKKIRRARNWREVYDGNPWTNPRAWSRAEIQALVTR
jgi:DNA gyrase inhibitor GyrI